MAKFIYLRDCPMCGSSPTPETGPRVTTTNQLDLETGQDYGPMWHTVDCVNCGATVENEYLEEAVRLWNGEPPLSDDECTPTSEGGE